jgi:hypothetical protein
LTLRAAHLREGPARDNLEGAEKPDFKWRAHPRRRVACRTSLAGSNTRVKPNASSPPGSQRSVVGIRLASPGRTLLSTR